MPKGIYKRTKKAKANISLARRRLVSNAKGKHWKLSKEIRKKQSLARKGKKYKPMSKEGKKNISLGHQKLVKEGRHHCWKGGVSFEPYSVDWTETLKRSIRERDRYTCQICGEEPSIQIHHIDYNKKNCNPGNLTTLCQNCHPKTNFCRNNWIKHFNNNDQ